MRERLRVVRAEQFGGTTNAFAQATGLSPAVVAEWFAAARPSRGKPSVPRLEHLALVAHVTGRSLDWLLGADDVPPMRAERSALGALGAALRADLYARLVTAPLAADGTHDAVGRVVHERLPAADVALLDVVAQAARRTVAAELASRASAAANAVVRALEGHAEPGGEGHAFFAAYRAAVQHQQALRADTVEPTAPHALWPKVLDRAPIRIFIPREDWAGAVVADHLMAPETVHTYPMGRLGVAWVASDHSACFIVVPPDVVGEPARVSRLSKMPPVRTNNVRAAAAAALAGERPSGKRARRPTSPDV